MVLCRFDGRHGRALTVWQGGQTMSETTASRAEPTVMLLGSSVPGRDLALAFERLRLVVEPGGAAGLAAVLAGKVETDGLTAVILSGGNVDPAAFARVLTETSCN